MLAPGRGPEADARGVTFRLADPGHRLAGVRLVEHAGTPAERLTFHRDGDGWSLRFARPSLDRMEYQFEIQGPGGTRETLCDPGNPRRAPGAFGEKSVIEFPGYRSPWWLDAVAPAGSRRPLAVAGGELGQDVHATLWAPAGLPDDTAAPTVFVHDGPELDALGGVLRWAAAVVTAGRTGPFRVALLAPGERNRWYAADPLYAQVLTHGVVPAVQALAPTTARLGAGASLGALAMLHAHRQAPGTFDALFLQSGSFFTPVLDPQERGFARFGPVSAFVEEVAAAAGDPAPVPTAMTCGALEENLANNRAMAATLARLGYPVTLAVTPDLHNVTAWRDAFDPYLTRLVQEATDAA